MNDSEVILSVHDTDWESQALEVELTTKCTLECPSCPRSLDPAENQSVWDTGHMPTEFAKRIADTTNFTRYLFVGCYGDAIYHPDFLEICDYYQNSKGKRLHIHTNGSAKPKKFWDTAAQMKWSPATEFVFSVDGLADTNHLYRINSKWDQIEYAMRTMCSIPPGRKPYMVWKYLVFPYNQHQVEQARQLAEEIGFDEFSPRRSWRTADQYPSSLRHLYVF
jgi:MoaA/NifB/PqqE/SkfB family radical SAM enzyme